MHDDFAICLERLFSHMLVYTPWRRRRNALGAPCALCARRRCAVTTLCTPRARRERSMTTQSIAGQNSVGARWHAVGAPRKRHCRRGRAVTSPRYGKCKIIHYIFQYFRAIPRRSEKFQIAVPTPWNRSRVWQGLNRRIYASLGLNELRLITRGWPRQARKSKHIVNNCNISHNWGICHTVIWFHSLLRWWLQLVLNYVYQPMNRIYKYI